MILVQGATIVLVAYFLFNLRRPLRPSRMFNGALPSHHYSWRRCLSTQQLGNRREIPPRLWVSFADHLNEIPFLKCYRFLIDTAIFVSFSSLTRNFYFSLNVQRGIFQSQTRSRRSSRTVFGDLRSRHYNGFHEKNGVPEDR
jgi:hypothetical protein